MARVIETFCLTVLLLLVAMSTHLLAAESDEALLRGAAERIEKHRKATATITLVDQAGKPVPGARLTIEQVRHTFLFGCNFFAFGRLENEKDEQAYRTQFSALMNYATLAFYWPSYEPRKGEPQYEQTEKVARWCKEHGIITKGHPLAWNFMEPRWLPDNTAAIKQLQLSRITDCVTRFRGLIDIWDVVNEATHFEREQFKKRAPKMTKMWEEAGRVPFVDECFQAARRAGPNATLLINDYRTDPQYAQVIEQMAQPNGKRAFDVIGIQSHMHGGVWSNQKIWDVCQRFARFGVPLHFTELTIISGESDWEHPRPWDSTAEGEKQQAEDVRRVYTMLFSHPAVTAITWWDFSDRGAWKGAPAGLIGKDMQPKPAYRVLKDLVKNQWWTKVKQTTDVDGQVAFRGFLGDYKVKGELKNGKVIHSPLSISAGAPNSLEIVVK